MINDDTAADGPYTVDLKTVLALHAIAIDGMAEGLCVLDGELRVVLFNRRLREILDLPRDIVRIGAAGGFDKPGTTVANVAQQAWFTDAVSKVVLPMFKARNKPFLVVVWSRDPDGSQHNQGDSLNALNPGINGPTSLAAIRNADDNLRQIVEAVKQLGLADTTDVVIAADHGFSTIAKESKTSLAAKVNYPDVPPGFLPPGFLAVDLARSLGLPLFSPNERNARVADDAYPKSGNGVIGPDPARPDIVVAANGGSDLVYLPSNDRDLAARVVRVLLEQDYVSGLFVTRGSARSPERCRSMRSTCRAAR